MKTFLALAALVAVALAKPGGYTAIGGVYKFNGDRNLDFMDAARDAGKKAWNQKFESELVQEDQDRGARRAPQYVPTFFTEPINHGKLINARSQVQPSFVRTQRQTPAIYHPVY